MRNVDKGTGDKRGEFCLRPLTKVSDICTTKQNRMKGSKMEKSQRSRSVGYVDKTADFTKRNKYGPTKILGSIFVKRLSSSKKNAAIDQALPN